MPRWLLLRRHSYRVRSRSLDGARQLAVGAHATHQPAVHSGRHGRRSARHHTVSRRPGTRGSRRWFVCSPAYQRRRRRSCTEAEISRPITATCWRRYARLAILASMLVLCVLTRSLLRRRRAVRHGRLSQAQHLARASRRGPTLSRTAYLVAPTHTVIHHPCPCTVTLHRLPVVVRVHPPLAATSRLLTAMRRPFVQQCPS